MYQATTPLCVFDDPTSASCTRRLTCCTRRRAAGAANEPSRSRRTLPDSLILHARSSFKKTGFLEMHIDTEATKSEGGRMRTIKRASVDSDEIYDDGGTR
jgi:hypothetical protein